MGIFNKFFGSKKSPNFMESNDYAIDNSRASLGDPYYNAGNGSKIPFSRLAPWRIYRLAYDVAELRSVIEHIQRELFKHGLEVVPNYRYKCKECGKEFKIEPVKSFTPIDKIREEQDNDLKCDVCGSEGKFDKPNPKNRLILQSLLDNPVNNNRQNLFLVSRKYERDLDIMDNAYVAITRKYEVEILSTPTKAGATRRVIVEKNIETLNEILRIHPVHATMLSNSDGDLGVDDGGNYKWICPDYRHRDKYLDAPVCDIVGCGLEAFTAVLETNAFPYGVPAQNTKKSRYAEHELIRTAGKFDPDLLYGNSPINAIWKKAMSLFYQDEYVWKYFDKDRPPKTFLFIGSSNYESVKAFWERQKGGAREEPHLPRIFLLDEDDISKKIQKIDVTPNFQELELLGLRKELRQIIGGIYGFQPISMGDPGGGGTSSGGSKGGSAMIQLTLTNRAVKTYQMFLNDYFFKPISNAVGVNDWNIVIIEPEEIDEMREEQVKAIKLKNAQMLEAMSYDTHFDADGNLVHSSFPNPEKMKASMGLGSNIKNGNSEKVGDPKVTQDKATNFEGEGLDQRPSDVGGDHGGAPTSDFSLENKSADIIKNGMYNNWTLTTMGKKLSKITKMDESKAIQYIKQRINDSV